MKIIKKLKRKGYTGKVIIELTLKEIKLFNESFKRGEKITVELRKSKEDKNG